MTQLTCVILLPGSRNELHHRHCHGDILKIPMFVVKIMSVFSYLYDDDVREKYRVDTGDISGIGSDMNY